MIPPDLPADETERLALLRSLRVLDQGAEPALDRITRTAARLFQVPMALVTLVDSDRQWFVSRVGMDLRQTPRRDALCGHAILQPGTMVVRDTHQDPRFADNPLVTGAPHIRFYAGRPLRSRHGLALGTLCLFDRRPRSFDEAAVAALDDLADMAQAHFHGLEATLQTRAVQASLERSEMLFARVVTHAAVGIAVASPEGVWQEMNQRFCDIVGHDRTALLGTPIADIVHPDDRTSGTWLVRQLIQGRADALNLQLRFVRADGGLSWTQVGASVLRDRQGDPESLVAVVTDINEHQRAQEDLERLQRTLELRIAERTGELNHAIERLRTITDNAPAMIAIIDRDLRYRFQNHAFTDWFGIAPGALIGTDARDSWGEAAYARLRPALDTVFAGKRATVEYPLPGRSGTMWFYATLVPRVEDDGEVSGFYLLAQDVTERKALYERIEHEAAHDALTGLPNRRALMQRIEEAMARVRRRGRAMAVLFMDIDGFKHMNDTLGHEFGDAVLQHFAAGVRTAVRDTDLVSRLAGDEFVIVLEDLDAAGERQAHDVATAVLERVRAIQEVQGVAIGLTTSIGVAIHRPQDEETPQELLHRADTAMYRAKAAGKRQVAF